MNFDYHAMRTFADSWGLLVHGAGSSSASCFGPFGPGARKAGEDAAKIPFKED